MLEIIILTILIVVGFIAAGWYTHNRNQQQAHAFERELDPDSNHAGSQFRRRYDAVFDQELQDDQDSDADTPKIRLDDDLDLHELENFSLTPPQADTVRSAKVETEQADEPADELDHIIALTIMAPAETLFTGKALKHLLDSHDLHFGDMQIYHRYEASDRRQPLFSVANILDPGTLLPDQMPSLQTPGLLLFARLPGAIDGMAVLDLLLENAQQMATQLGGVLCDEQRQPLTDTTIESMRNRIIDNNLTQQDPNKSGSDDRLN